MKMQEIKFGVEIETIGQTRGTVARAIQCVVGGATAHLNSSSSYDPWEVIDSKGRKWSVVSDASLTSVSSDLRAEVVTPILEFDDIDELQRVIRAVKTAGARTDACCGIHVHLSHPDVTPKSLANLAKIVYKQEDIIFKALGVNETRMNQYCKPIDPGFIGRISRNPPRSFEHLSKQWYGRLVTVPARYDHTRYHILNLNGYFLRGAVEIRAYSGSLHAGKVKAAILFSMALMTKSINCNSASAVKRTYNAASSKYDMRVFLVSGLGMVGEEFKSTRMHLLANLEGNSAWKNGRPIKQKTEAGDTSPAPETAAPCEYCGAWSNVADMSRRVETHNLVCDDCVASYGIRVNSGEVCLTQLEHNEYLRTAVR